MLFSPLNFKEFLFFGLISILFFSPAYASSDKTSKTIIGSQAWVEEKVKEYPELVWLLKDTSHQTQEGKSDKLEQSWSQKLTGHHYPEFERTLLSMLSLHLMVEGSDQAYDYFAQLQSPSERISRSHFASLHEFAKNVIRNDPKRLKALEINLLLGDMGKTPLARKKAQQYGISEADHDLFLEACLEKCPQIFPTFMKLPIPTQNMIKDNTGLLHFGHLAHVEGGPEILSKLKHSKIFKNASRDFDFDVLTFICDLSAARGHEDNRGSKVLTDNTFKVIEGVKDTIHFLAHNNEEESLRFYLNKRARWLKLNEQNEECHILARFAAMLRLFSPEEGHALKQAYTSLSPDQRKIIEESFNPFTYRHQRTPTYVPALLVNILDTLSKKGVKKSKAIEVCIHKGAVFVATVLSQYRHGLSGHPYNPNLTLNFNKVAGQARDDVQQLDHLSYIIKPDGLVELN